MTVKPRTFLLPCKDPDAAAAFASWSTDQDAYRGLVVDVMGREVRFRVSRSGIPWELASAATAGEYADENEVCAVVEALTAPRRRR